MIGDSKLRETIAEAKARSAAPTEAPTTIKYLRATKQTYEKPLHGQYLYTKHEPGHKTPPFSVARVLILPLPRNDTFAGTHVVQTPTFRCEREPPLN